MMICSSRLVGCSLVLCLVALHPFVAGGGDWPQWRYDEHRTGVTPESLPGTLYLQWRRDLPAPVQAYSTYTYYYAHLQADATYYPVVMGNQVFVGMSANNSMSAFNTATGVRNWVFYAGAAIRCTPVAVGGKVYFGSDDGWFYCLNASDGSVSWKYRAGPSERKMMSYGRLISVWPVRGGAAYKDGKIYFAAGMYSFEGQFAYCLNAVDGLVVWKNRGLNGLVTLQGHTLGAQRGPPPVGPLTFKSDDSAIFIPAGFTAPASINPLTGTVLAFNHGVRHGTAGTWNGGYGWWVDQAGWPSVVEPIAITANGQSITASTVTGLGVAGTVGSIFAADGKLFAMTKQGSLYCFAGTSVTPTTYSYSPGSLPNTTDGWTTQVQTMLSRNDLKQGLALVWGIGSGRLIEELAKQAPELTIVAADPDPAKVAATRATFDAAGLYGSRVTALLANPMDIVWGPSQAALIASEDANVAGFGSGSAFAWKLYRSTRPSGGEIWLPTSATDHSTFVGWVSSATNMPVCTVVRNGNYTQMKRQGMTVDQARCTTPMGIASANAQAFTFGYIPGSITNGYQANHGVDIYSGLSLTNVPPGVEPAPPALNNLLNSSVNGGENFTVTGTNALYQVPDSWRLPWGYGCDQGRDWGSLHLERSGGPAFYDNAAKQGIIMISDTRPMCGQASMAGGNSVIVAGGFQSGCECNYALKGMGMTLVSMPDYDVESWCWWSDLAIIDSIHEIPIKKMGVNFGAPGDRMTADDRMLWTYAPKQMAIGTYTPETPVYFNGAYTAVYNHMGFLDKSPARPGDADRRWVSASYVSGATNIQVRVIEPPVALTTVQAPVIDGVLNDACWNGQQVIRMANRQDCTAQLRYDANNLYMAVAQPAGQKGYWIRLKNRDGSGTVRLGRKADGTQISEGLDVSQWTDALSGNGSTGELAVALSGLQAAGLVKTQMIVNLAMQEGDYGFMYAMMNREWAQAGFTGGWGIGDRMSPLYFDAAGGVAAVPKAYTVKLYFAEMEGKTPGQRKFNIKLQGNTVLSNFDIMQETGGANQDVVKTFSNVVIYDDLNVELVPVAGTPVISGLELVATDVPVNIKPAIGSALTASVVAGQAFNYTITAWGSAPVTYGASSLPAGLTLSGGTISGTPAAGTYNIGLTANNAYGSDSKTLVLTVVTPVLTTITVSPSTTSVAPAGTQQFTASGKDQFGNVMSNQPAFAWSVSGGGSINSASGLFTAGATEGGPYTVTASAGGKSGTAGVSVSAMPVGLLAWWKFDESSGTTAADASGNGHVATLQNTAVFAAGGRTGNALQLTGANDEALASPIVTLTADWTITAWFTAPLPNTATWHTLTRGQSADHHIIADSALNLGVYASNNGDFRSCGYNLGGLASGWHHVTAVGSGAATTFYVDGVSVGSSDRKIAADVYAIGNWQGGGQRFTDKIDDVRVYNRALAASEIQALAGAGAGVDSYGIPDTWKVQNFGSATATNAGAMDDADGDGMCNLAEYIAGTSPTNAASVLKVQGAVSQAGTLALSFLTVTGRVYTGRYCDDLLAGSWGVLAPSNVPGTGGQITITDTNKPVIRFYRLGVR